MIEFTGERLIPGESGDDLWNEHFARYAFAAGYARGRRVLDLGCGTGYGAAHLAQTAFHVTGVDISPEAIGYARGHYALGNLTFTEAPATTLPFEDAAFDLVTCFEVIEHIENWSMLLAEALRVLSPEGLAIISTPNRLYYTASRGNTGPNPFHVHEFDAAEFDGSLRQTFPAVTMLLQNRNECIAFYPHRLFPRAEAALESTSGSPETAHFFVALCGRRADIIPPRTFVFVPRAANLLREREQHIALLEKELAGTKSELAGLYDAHQKLNAHLESQNRWALNTAGELRDAQARIVELQDELQAAVRGYESKIRELEAENRSKAEWARDLAARLEQAESVVSLTRASRWVKVGRRIGLGPDLPA